MHSILSKILATAPLSTHGSHYAELILRTCLKIRREEKTKREGKVGRNKAREMLNEHKRQNNWRSKDRKKEERKNAFTWRRGTYSYSPNCAIVAFRKVYQAQFHKRRNQIYTRYPSSICTDKYVYWHPNWHLVGSCMTALPTVLSPSSIFPPSSSYYAFIPARRNSARVLKCCYFNLFYLVEFVWVWNCVTWNCISHEVSFDWEWKYRVIREI